MRSSVVMLVNNDMTADARVHREAEALGLAGYDVTVLALRGAGLPDAEQREGYRLRRVADSSTASWRRPLAKARQTRGRSVSMTREAIAIRPDVVHAHDSDTLAAASRVRAACGSMLVYDAHELYPDMLAEHGLRGSWPVQTYWTQLERHLVPLVDASITVSGLVASELTRRFGVDPVVLRNVPKLESLVVPSPLRDELPDLGGRIVCLYQGVLVPGRGLETLVDAVALLPNVVLAVQGFGPAEDAVRQRAASLGIEGRVYMMGRKAPELLHAYACGADVGVVIYEHTSLNNYLAAPNKLYSYLMAGLPVASSNFPGLAAVVEGLDVGATFDPSSAGSIAHALDTIATADDRLGMAARARQSAEVEFNWDHEAKRLLALYAQLPLSR